MHLSVRFSKSYSVPKSFHKSENFISEDPKALTLLLLGPLIFVEKKEK